MLFSSAHRLHLQPLSPPPRNCNSEGPISHFSVCGSVPERILRPHLRPATRASKHISNLRSPDKPDSVLQFLRQAGVTETHIRAAALHHPAFLCYNVENSFKPRMAELQEIGFSPSHISLLISIRPDVFIRTKLKQKMLFWIQIFGSVDKLFMCLRRNFFLLSSSLENTIVPNVSFLQEQCSLSAREIARVIQWAPQLVTFSPESLKTFVRRAGALGIPNSSGMFVHALSIVSRLNESIVNARLLYLKNLGLSIEEVTSMIRKCLSLLGQTEELLGNKMEFLLKEAGCDKIHVVRNPVMLTCSLGKRLMPRTIVQKLLKSEGLPVANKSFVSFMVLTEKQFVDKFVLPYPNFIPGLHQAYIDACSGKLQL